MFEVRKDIIKMARPPVACFLDTAFSPRAILNSLNYFCLLSTCIGAGGLPLLWGASAVCLGRLYSNYCLQGLLPPLVDGYREGMLTAYGHFILGLGVYPEIIGS